MSAAHRPTWLRAPNTPKSHFYPIRLCEAVRDPLEAAPAALRLPRAGPWSPLAKPVPGTAASHPPWPLHGLARAIASGSGSPAASTSTCKSGDCPRRCPRCAADLAVLPHDGRTPPSELSDTFRAASLHLYTTCVCAQGDGERTQRRGVRVTRARLGRVALAVRTIGKVRARVARVLERRDTPTRRARIAAS